MDKSFNLLDEPWLSVRYIDGHVTEVGLLRLFADAGQISALAETSPPNLAAQYRVLLAITHRAFMQHFGTWTTRDMAQHCRDGLPVDVIHAYLERWRERFWLFHMEHPFMQVAALATAVETREKCKSWTQIALASTSGNAPVLFDHAVDNVNTSISASRALCELLGFLQFVPGGLVKTLRDSDKAGALANTAAILPIGGALGQTLCLAMHPAQLEPNGDLPTWEKPVIAIPDLLAGPSLATGPNDRYTRLSRAVLLLPDVTADGTTVTQLRLAAGVALADDEHAPDAMASYRAGSNGMVRLSFTEGRAVWRDLPTFLPDASGKNALPAAVLGWSQKVLAGFGAHGAVQSVMVLGLASKEAKLLRWRVERFSLPQLLLEQAEAADELRSYMREGEALYGSMRNVAALMLARAMPDPSHKDTRNRARQVFDNGSSGAAYFSTLERHLPQLLQLIAEGQMDAADTRWRAARLSAVELAWATVCRQLGDNTRALRARALAEPDYLVLIQPLYPHSNTEHEEIAHV